MSNETKGYLYHRWRGRFEVLYGTIVPLGYGGRRKDRARFEYRSGRKDKYVQCWGEPGFIYYGVVWLQERDDELARKLFMEYEKNCIKELEEKIARHQWCIDTLIDQEVTDEQLSNL